MGVCLKEFLHLCDRLAGAYERLVRFSYTTVVSDGNVGAIAHAIAIVKITSRTGNLKRVCGGRDCLHWILTSQDEA